MQSYVEIEGLEVEAKHGCLDFEKTTPQKFVFDCRFWGDFSLAMSSDSLDRALDYGEAAKIIADVTVNNSFNLIERLSKEVLGSLSKKYPYLDKIDLKVSKPMAPIDIPKKSVAYFTSLCSRPVYLGLGSSMGDKAAYIDFALKALSKFGSVKKCSDKIVTKPYGGVAENDFLNAVVLFNTFLNPSELLSAVNEIEAQAKRDRSVTWGDRTLDIDIISYDNIVLNTKKLILPHADYRNRDFVLYPLRQIAPDFVCPETGKSITELVKEFEKNTESKKRSEIATNPIVGV